MLFSTLPWHNVYMEAKLTLDQKYRLPDMPLPPPVDAYLETSFFDLDDTVQQEPRSSQHEHDPPHVDERHPSIASQFLDYCALAVVLFVLYCFERSFSLVDWDEVGQSHSLPSDPQRQRYGTKGTCTPCSTQCPKQCPAKEQAPSDAQETDSFSVISSCTKTTSSVTAAS